jgi:geranylgeranyl diphosphate synthase type 3
MAKRLKYLLVGAFQLKLILKIFIEELINLHRGQGKDIYWRDNNICPTEEQYKQMVSESNTFHIIQSIFIRLIETGGLFRLAVRLMQSFSKNKT